MKNSMKAQMKHGARGIEPSLEGREAGGTLIEYVFLATLIGMAAITAMQVVGLALATKFDEIASTLV